MKFPLRDYLYSKPIPSLRGGQVRYKPVIYLTIIGPSNQETRLVLVDSGSDDVVFPAAVASRIGVDLSQAPQRSAQGAGAAQPVPVLYAPVILVLSDSQQTVRWRATVGFTQARLRFPLFGIASGLEFFRTTLDVSARELELVANASLPSTQDLIP